MEKFVCILMCVLAVIGMSAADLGGFWWCLNGFNLFMWTIWTCEAFDRG